MCVGRRPTSNVFGHMVRSKTHAALCVPFALKDDKRYCHSLGLCRSTNVQRPLDNDLLHIST